ncbi:DUF551 domain-containing protein [Gluconobacter cerinus]|uniref:DUF551 domain-containing protein n=1 Tax=Gluconobacter cerinus TaxID=38307 RepID=A0A1B6VKH9_9PROT|nr:DUF551 domain-containing protein [Gluconobacter cerinus]OAJ67731.1 hypothetical protein A0123_01773 [Gluconobacter cerinus]
MSDVTDPRVEAAIDAVIKARGWRDSCWGDGAIVGFDYSNEEKQRHVIRDHEAEEREGRTVILFETKDYEEYQREFHRACIRREVSAALKAADAAAWQPIESAPKDGTVINVLLRHDISDSDREFYCYPQSRVSFGWAWENGKFRPCTGLSLPVFIEPTHWMPLPHPPEAKP